jgi:tetratricopeptide (TPR) repeat protein
MMKKIQKIFLTGIVLFLLSGVDNSKASEIDEYSLNRARELFYKSIEDKDHIHEAIELFEKLKDNEALTGRVTTYLGALTALKGRFAFWPQKKLALANKGLAMMDEGILTSPDDVEALFVHGSTCYYLPFFFGRKDDAIRSLKKIIHLLPEQMYRYDPDLTNNVINFIKENVELEPVEIEKLNSIQGLLALG